MQDDRAEREAHRREAPAAFGATDRAFDRPAHALNIAN